MAQHYQWVERRFGRKEFLLWGVNQYEGLGMHQAVLTSHLDDEALVRLLNSYPLGGEDRPTVKVQSFWVDARHPDVPYRAVSVDESVGKLSLKNFWQFSYLNGDFDSFASEETINIEVFSAKEPFHRPGLQADSRDFENIYETLPLDEFLSRTNGLLAMPRRPIYPNLEWVRRAWIGKQQKEWPEVLLLGEDETHRIVIHYYSTA